MREIRIAINMRALRIANEYPQKYISELIHVARQTYSLYENGKGLPDLEAVCYLADFYGVSVDMLLYADLSAKQIADSTANEHFAIAPETSAIPLNGAEARMLINYKSLPSEVQKEVREFVRFKKKWVESQQVSDNEK
ncbi:helix-turn-helix domain-containing protein [Candidatus Merdisoma sp. JLR.KK006]|uniref:helix-turn-helix transcriptional regulator n=1 Tax=Candidatus Merdisoma sp. JLR.KK006 TaxID=3112626 RepID=UPI002FF404E1